MGFMQNTYTMVDFMKMPFEKRSNTFVFLPGNDNMVDNLFCAKKIRDFKMYPGVTFYYRKRANHGSILWSAKYMEEHNTLMEFMNH